jgi:hypothetical protein
MAPQLRRSRRQQQVPDAQPAAADTDADVSLVKNSKLNSSTPADSHQQPDQQVAGDDEVLPRSKAPCRANTSPGGAAAAAATPKAAAPAAVPVVLSKIEIERAARIAANKVSCLCQPGIVPGLGWLVRASVEGWAGRGGRETE